MDLDLSQLRALDATVRGGTLEAAARALHVTPSAVSQRLRALEVATGRILLVRTKPVQVTESEKRCYAWPGRSICSPPTSPASSVATPRPSACPRCRSRSTPTRWPRGAARLAPLAGDVCFDLYREDQEHQRPAPCRHGHGGGDRGRGAGTGLHLHPPGWVGYRPMATPGFAAELVPRRTHAPGARPGPGRRLRPQGRPAAPLSARAGRFRRRPTGALRARLGGLRRRRHPRPGLGHGARSPGERRNGGTGRPRPGRRVDVVLYWQQWRLRSATLDRVREAVLEAAGRELDQPVESRS